MVTRTTLRLLIPGFKFFVKPLKENKEKAKELFNILLSEYFKAMALNLSKDDRKNLRRGPWKTIDKLVTLTQMHANATCKKIYLISFGPSVTIPSHLFIEESLLFLVLQHTQLRLVLEM